MYDVRSSVSIKNMLTPIHSSLRPCCCRCAPRETDSFFAIKEFDQGGSRCSSITGWRGSWPRIHQFSAIRHLSSSCITTGAWIQYRLLCSSTISADCGRVRSFGAYGFKWVANSAQGPEIVIGVTGSSWQPSQPLLDLGCTTWRSDM